MKKLINLLSSSGFMLSIVPSVVGCFRHTMDLKYRINVYEPITIVSAKTVADFKTKLITELQKQLKFINDSNIDIFKEDGITALSYDDIQNATKIKIKTKASAKFKIKGIIFVGEKNITVSWTEQQ